MRDYKIFDDFKDRLPEISFAKKLSEPVHKETPANWNKRAARDGEIFVQKLRFENFFPDPEGVLETAFSDFREFMKFAHIEECEGGISLSFSEDGDGTFEAHTIEVLPDKIIIHATDTEGVRRALIYIEDEMKRRSGSFIPIGKIERKPYIKNRISRCYFTPSSHAAIEEEQNELRDDIDYYPDEYLNRLAHDGINALWLGASLRYLTESDVIPEYGVDAERRIAKLNAVIEKCKRYGIGIFLFAVDPASSYHNPHLLRHPELMNDGDSRWRFLCPSSEGGYKYLTEAVKSVFRSAPGLKGYINLSVGESLSTCASDSSFACKRCRERFGTVGRTLAFVEKTIADAMHEVNPSLEYISWTYAQRGWDYGDIRESCEVRDESVIHLQNFEDHGRPVQLGKERYAVDYWLSYVGPGKLFSETVKINERRGIKTYAKIQVCSSHEISTVPYVAAPGILYDKYSYFKEHGISGVMQCWFFGNYPCLMNKAAGELAFLPFAKTKEEFLLHLASIYWGEDGALLAKAFSAFEEAYVNYPVSVSFEWLGPMQDSPACPLHLLPSDRPMPSTWLATDMSGGDRIGEFLTNGHSLEEAITLVGLMSEGWQSGLDMLSEITDHGKEERWEQLCVFRATGYIFRSGYNVLRFYEKRRLLGIGKGDPKKTLSEMRDIVLEEIGISEKLIPICEEDNRIGYHSEAHGHKIFKEKLLWRIAELKRLLDEDFAEVLSRIERGEAPLKFYLGEEPGTRRYMIGEDGTEFLETREGESPKTSIKMEECDTGYTLTLTAYELLDDQIFIRPEFRMFFPTVPLRINSEGLSLSSASSYSIPEDRVEPYLSQFGFEMKKTGEETEFKISFRREDFGMEKGEPFRLDIERFPKDSDIWYGTSRAKEALRFSDRSYTRLIHGTITPEAYCFFIPKK